MQRKGKRGERWPMERPSATRCGLCSVFRCDPGRGRNGCSGDGGPLQRLSSVEPRKSTQDRASNPTGDTRLAGQKEEPDLPPRSASGRLRPMVGAAGHDGFRQEKNDGGRDEPAPELLARFVVGALGGDGGGLVGGGR